MHHTKILQNIFCEVSLTVLTEKSTILEVPNLNKAQKFQSFNSARSKLTGLSFGRLCQGKPLLIGRRSLSVGDLSNQKRRLIGLPEALLSQSPSVSPEPETVEM